MPIFLNLSKIKFMKTYGVDYLQYEDIIKIIDAPEKAEMSAKAMLQVKKSQDNVKKIIADGKTVYGINTGFGPLCDTKISDDEISQLQHNLIISHSVGVGKPIDKKLSKIMMVAKIHALSKGFSEFLHKLWKGFRLWWRKISFR
jgi:histidine ammonia-lyase